MEIDTQNKEFNLAYQIVEKTRQNLFLTGKAGTGKTTFLKYIKDNVRKNMAVVAPTGVAAINAGGVTIHSLFQIDPYSIFPPNDPRLRTKAPPEDLNKVTIYNTFQLTGNKRNVLENLELLIIDEISMVRCDLLDLIDKLLRTFGGGNSSYPFGGKQVVFIGDPFQLPPIVTREVWSILSPFYKSRHFFNAHSFKEAKPLTIELKKIYRQNNQAFINILNRIRIGQVDQQDLTELNNRIKPLTFNYAEQGYIYLGIKKGPVNCRNEEELARLTTPAVEFQATVRGIFDQSEMPTLQRLKLKQGAQVMFIKNDSGAARLYYNGKVGKISKIEDNKITVETESGISIPVERATWKKIKYEWDKEKKEMKEIEIGSFIQFPLILAWAITIHKSQGLTFEKAFVDLNGSFDDGQVYVGLSRCTSLEGIKMASRLHPSDIKTSPEVKAFSNTYLTDARVDEFLNNFQFFEDCLLFEQALEMENLASATEILIYLIKEYPDRSNDIQDLKNNLSTAILDLQTENRLLSEHNILLMDELKTCKEEKQ